MVGNIRRDAEASGSLAMESTAMNPDNVIEVCHLTDAAATLALGRRLAARLLQVQGAAAALSTAPHQPNPTVPPSAPPASQLLLLRGELGAGKTCLVQGLAEGLGIVEPVTSPSFALAHHYRGQRGSLATALVHLDLYRLEQPAAADELFAQEEEEARDVGAVLAVEWPERLSFKPEPCWWLELELAGAGRLARLGH
jgi:tRNA threonylcarbamoyladenosine biosynthesis protein TsaE